MPAWRRTARVRLRWRSSRSSIRPCPSMPVCTQRSPIVHAEIGRAQLDDPRATLIAGAVRRIWSHNQLCLAGVQEACDVLGRLCVAPIVLPGAVTAIAALDDSRSRLLDRVDLLIEPHHVPRVATALFSTGAELGRDAMPLIQGQRSWPPQFDAGLAHGKLVVRWQLLPLRHTVLDGWRVDAREPLATTVRANSLAGVEAMVAALSRLDSEPDGIEWTNLVLEVGRLARLIDANAGEAVARIAYEVGRYEQWSSFLRLIAHLSGDASVAERYGATPPPVFAAPPRWAHERTARMLREYRADARVRHELATARGFSRYLARRWQVPSRRDLPREGARRAMRAVRR